MKAKMNQNQIRTHGTMFLPKEAVETMDIDPKEKTMKMSPKRWYVTTRKSL
jgi:hypothetical protein